MHGDDPSASSAFKQEQSAIGPDMRGEMSGSKHTRDTDTINSTNGLRRDINRRQMILIAAGGSIGAGLFVGSGQALSSGGPASLLLGFAISGIMVCCTMASLGEMATSYPIAGAFYDYAVRFIGTPIGFAMGWNFVFNWLVVLPFELITIGAQLRYWNPDLKAYVFIGPFLAFLCLISFMGAKWFAELEHWLGLCKAVAICTFLCFAFALVTAGIPGDPRGAAGARYWTELPPFRNGCHGFFAVFRIAGMAYGGTELLGLTAAECRRPHRVMPVATKVVFFRLVVFYLGALLMLGFAVPADSESLPWVGHGPKESPFVLAANLAKVPALAHFFNAMIVAALLAMANTSAFASSRALQAICQKGMGPELFARVRGGVPVPALIVAFTLALLSLITIAPGGGTLFDWLLSLSGISNYMTWAAICYSHIRMRAAMKVQGRSARDELIWRSPFGVAGSYLGITICAFALLALVANAVWPAKNSTLNPVTVVRDLLGFAFAGALLAGYLVYRKVLVPRANRRNKAVVGQPGDDEDTSGKFLIPLDRIDLVTGFRDRRCAADADREADEEEAEKLAKLGWDQDWSWSRKVLFRAKVAVGWPWWGKRV